MPEEITAERMAKLLDDWAGQPDPFIGNMHMDFGLSEAQRDEPVVRAAATFAGFRFVGSGRPSSAGPIVLILGDTWERLNYLRDEHPECLWIWHDLASCTEHHLVKAMLNDLLWLLQYDERQKPYRYARAAISHYLQIFDELPNLQVEHRDMHQHDLLCRAAELTKAVNAQEEYLGIAKRCEAMFSETPGEDSFWAIRAAACLPKEHRPADLQDRIESLHATYATSSDSETWTGREALFQVELEMAKKDKDKEREGQIRASASRLFIEEARSTDSDLRAGRFLQEAEEWAKGADEESALVREIREVRSDLVYDGDFHEVSVEQSVPAEEMQRITDPVRTAASIAGALRLTAGCGLKMLGAIDSIEREAEQIQNEPRLVNLIGRVYIVHGNIECCRPEGDDAKRLRAIAELFRMQALIAANLVIIPCLTAIRERPDSERANLRQFMADSAAIGEFEAERFEKAFGFYWVQDYASAVQIAVPMIESSVRNLARKVGVEISFPAKGEDCGGLRGLKPMLDDLRHTIGESNARMLAYLLVDNHAMNLRDNYAHGVPSEDPHADAALVLWIVLWLANLRPV